MNLYKRTYYLIKILCINLLTLLFSYTNGISTSTKKPTLADYQIGEQLTWDWRRSVNGEVRAQGEDFQEVVAYKNTLGFTYGTDTVTIASILDRAPSKTPRYDWPLKVGKKWKYEVTWSYNEGTTGKTSQDAV